MDIELVIFMFMLTVMSLYFNFAISLYGVVAKVNLVKKLIALTILQDTINIFTVLVGYRLLRPGLTLQPPVVIDLNPTPEVIKEFVTRSVDPLPQAFVLTAVVIGLAVTLFLTTIVLHVSRHFKTVNVDEIGRLKRGYIHEEAV
ncbi:MAG: sodium:proton antiporter [Zestosphaera sp.]